MQKKLLIILLFVLTFGLSSTYFLTKNIKEVVAEESNGYRVEEVFSDKFNKKELDSSWTLNDATLDLNYCGIHCISPVSYGYGIVINGATLGDKTRINFTIYPQAGQTESNISFMVGFQSPSTTMAEPNVDFKVQLWNNQLVFCDWQHNMAVNQEKINDHVLREFSGLFSDLLRTDVSIIIERKDSKTTESYVEYSRDGEVVYSSKDKAFTCEDPRNPYGYFGFFWDVLEMDVTNFEVYKDDVLVLDDDLSENSLTYSASDYKQGNFHINNDLNESKVYVSRVSSVVMNNANESIVNKNTLAKLENVSNPYSLGYSVKINSLEEGSFFGFGFGLGENDTKVDTKNAIGFIKKDALTAEIVVLKNGVIDRSNNYQVAIAKLGNGKYIDCTVKLGLKVSEIELPIVNDDSLVFDGWYNGETKLSADDVITENMELICKFSVVENPTPVDPVDPVEKDNFIEKILGGCNATITLAYGFTTMIALAGAIILKKKREN